MAKVSAGCTLLPMSVCGMGAGGGAASAAFAVDGLSLRFVGEASWSRKQQDRDHSPEHIAWWERPTLILGVSVAECLLRESMLG